MLISFFLVITISTSLKVTGEPSPRFHVEAWLLFRNREMDYSFDDQIQLYLIMCSKKASISFIPV